MIVLTSQFGIIFISVGVFLFVILLLVAVLLYARKKLTPQGEVTLDINAGEKSLVVDPGTTLLNSLSASGIFLPSACGGGGTTLV